MIQNTLSQSRINELYPSIIKLVNNKVHIKDFYNVN